MNNYKKEDVLSVVVSFNPTELIRENLDALTKQVAQVVVLDNGSNAEAVAILKDAEATHENLRVIYNEENKGIAARLNEGVALAKEMQKPLLLTMDQDTVLEDDCVEKQLKVLNTDDTVASVGIKRVEKHEEKEYYYKDYLITSGTLSKVSCLEKAGGYRDELFVDMVDIDISLALRKAGYNLTITNGAGMDHKVGEYEEKKILGITHRYLSHSPQRFYSLYKNTVIINRLYKKDFRKFCFKLNFFKVVEFIKICLEKDSREKYRNAIQGIKDGKKAYVTFVKEN